MGVVDMLAELVAVPTVNDPLRGLKVGESQGLKVKDVLSRHGMDANMTLVNGYPVLLYRYGLGRPVSLFMAHFDVVPPGPGWSGDPFEPRISEGRLYGRGSADDKSNVAAMVYALRDFEPCRGTLIVAFTGDEEIGGSNGAGWLAGELRREGLWPDYVVNGDGSFSRVILRRRNVFNVKVRVRSLEYEADGSVSVRRYTGESRVWGGMHAAYFAAGVDRHPLIEASLEARVSGFLVAFLRGEWVKSNVVPRSVEVGYISGDEGRSVYDYGLTMLLYSIVPFTRPHMNVDLYSDYGVTVTPNVYRFSEGWHEVVLDVRVMTSDPGLVEEAFHRVAEGALGSVEYEVEVSGGGGYLYTDPGARLAAEALRINSRLGLPGVGFEAAGASDSRYFSPWGSQAIDYGPLGGGIHGPDEWVSLAHLEKAVEFYRRLATSLHGCPG